MIALVLLTGQRIVDIMRLTTAHWLASEKVLHWPRTKNGKHQNQQYGFAQFANTFQSGK